MNFSTVLENTIYFLALINPPSKILFLCSKKPPFTRKQLFVLSFRSNVVALAILSILTSVGTFLLVSVFHVQIYSLSVAGGAIIFFIGFTAVRQGRFFFEEDIRGSSLTDISIMPLAAPLIAGPGVITAAISATSIYGIHLTILCLTIAIAINFFLMLLSEPIGRGMEKFHITGPIIRITGLIVTAVAVQMIFSGCETWIKHVLVAVT